MEEREPSELYEQFQSNHGAARDRMFDEDDLLEIFDYANDMGDNYTMLEVLFTTARRYPESEEMNARRRYYLFDEGYGERLRPALNGLKSSSPLDYMLKTRLTVADPDEAVRRLTTFIEHTAEPLDDEAAIRFVEIFQELDRIDWLRDHAESLSQRFDYPTTVYYELSQVYSTRGDHAEALALAEKLTMMEPFNESFWKHQAAMADNAGKPEDALAAIDYALAVTPGDPEALQSKALLINAITPGAPEVADILLNQVAPADLLGNALTVVTEIMMKEKRDDAEILAFCRKYLSLHPASTDAVTAMLRIDKEAAAVALNEFDRENIFDATFWIAWSERLIAEFGDYGAAAILLWCGYMRQKFGPEHMPHFVDILFRGKCYEQILGFIPHIGGMDEVTVASVAVPVVLSLAMMQEPGAKEASTLAALLMPRIRSAKETSKNLSERALFTGALSLLESVAGELEAARRSPAEIIAGLESR